MEIGGGLATEKVTIPGWIHNTHAVYHMMVDYAPVFQDLELISRYKLDFVQPELSMTMPLSDGRAVCLYDDPKKTAENFAIFSKADAEAYLEMNAHFTKLVDDFIAPATYAEAHPPMEQLANLQKTEIGREVQAIQEKTPLEIVDRWFENEHIKGLMLYAACFWGLDYDLEGLGFLVPLMIERAAKYRLLKGGSHQLSNRLSKDIYAHGGMIFGSQLIKRIIIDDGRATGVELEDGTVHTASKFVASSLNPHQTFLDYVGEQHLDSNFVTRIKDWQWDTWSHNGVHLALSEPPDFISAKFNPDVNNAFVHILGYDSHEDMIDHWDAIHDGELLPEAGFNACFPSVHDPYQAPAGKATGLLSEHAPYELFDGGLRRLVPRPRAARRRTAGHAAHLRAQHDRGQHRVAVPLHAQGHLEQVPHHGEGRDQARRIQAVADGLPAPQRGVLQQPHAHRRSLCLRRERVAGRHGDLRSGLQRGEHAWPKTSAWTSGGPSRRS